MYFAAELAVAKRGRVNLAREDAVAKDTYGATARIGMADALITPETRPATVSRRHWYMVGVLTAAYFLSFLDRSSLSLLVGPIEHDLNLSDLQMSLLLGLAFGTLYAFLGIPFGVLADRINRRNLAIGGVGFWSVSTLIAGLASTYGQLFIGRIGVGVGEATLAPAAASMINDGFPTYQRGRAFSVFSIGTSLGAGCASLLGGAVIALVKTSAPVHVPLLGALHAWQIVLVIISLIGVPVIIAMLGVREPARTARGIAAPRLSETLGYMRRHWRLFVPLYVTNVIGALMPYSFYPWVPTAMIRLWHIERSSVGFILGLMVIFLSGFGIFVAGAVVDRLRSGGRHNAIAVIGTSCFLVLAVTAACMFMMPSAATTWLVIGVYIMLVHIYFPIALLGLSMIAPPSMMATVSAINFMLTGIIGLSLGPTLVVLVAKFYAGPAAIAWGISTVCGGLALLGALTFATLIKPLRIGDVPAL
jgi:MFS family permease